MAYPVTLEINLSQLSGLHSDLLLLSSNSNSNEGKYPVDIIIQCVDDEFSYQDLRSNLTSLLSTYNLQSHLNNFLYISHFQIENNASDYLNDEELHKHAYKNIKQLIKLTELKESTSSRDLSITIKNKKDKNLVITFDTPISMKHVWDNLCSNLIESLTLYSGNHVIREHLKDVEITKENLLKIQKQLRSRKNSFWNKSLANLCRMILYYMAEAKAIPKGDLPTSQQANFLFDLLALFNLIVEDNIQSEKDDYIRSLLINNN